MCQNALNITFDCRLSHLVYPTTLQELCFVTFVSEALTQEQLELPQVIVEVLFHVFEPKKLKVLVSRDHGTVQEEPRKYENARCALSEFLKIIVVWGKMSKCQKKP